jgi:hypothetical protein
MKRYIFVLAIAVLAMGGCSTQSTQLFNGQDFAGWDFFVPDENVDVTKVWTVQNGVVHCAGKPNGYMQTKNEYSDYKFHVEWRWVEGPSNSGVLLHKTGSDKLWPKSIECQLQSGNAGDFWLIDGTGVTVNDTKFGGKAGQAAHVPKKEKSNEKPVGQWNSYDIYCKGDTIKCYVNGLLQNEGTGSTETSGRICLQSEGAPIEFKNIYVELLN